MFIPSIFKVYPRFIPGISPGYPRLCIFIPSLSLHIQDIHRISQVYPKIVIFIPSITLHILVYKKFVDREVDAADPEEAQHTHHGVGVLLVQLNFLDALAGCPAQPGTLETCQCVPSQP